MDARLLYGTDEAPPATLRLNAGPLALTLAAGALHDLACDGIEVWHAVTFPLRDPDWWTPPYHAESCRRADDADGFRVEIAGTFATDPRVAGRLILLGRGDGSLRVEAEALTDRDLWVNRLGLCLLYSSRLADAACEIEHEDGRISRSRFPTLVPPWPPFMGIRAIRHEYAPGAWASCRFEGDSFEFEDQRNNADASFKVYSRSNLMPRPYRLRAGVPVRQALELRIERRALRAPPVPVPASAPTRDPLGLGLAFQTTTPPATLRAVADALRPDFLHLCLEPGTPQIGSALRAALDAIGRPVQVDLALPAQVADREAALDAARSMLGQALARIAVFPTDPEAVAAVRQRWPGVPVGGGTPHFFAQLNRIEDLGEVDFLTFTVCPLMHGADDASTMECPRSLPGQMATLARRWPGRPVRIGPSALAMRASPLGKLPACDGTRRMAMASDDPRARGLFGAAWALALVAAATQAGAEALTVMAVDGPSGVATVTGEDLRWHPVAAVLARLAGAEAALAPPVPPDAHLAALALRRGGRRKLHLANLTAEPLAIVPERWAAAAQRAVLDGEALRGAPGPDLPAYAARDRTGPLTFPPYALACLTEEVAP